MSNLPTLPSWNGYTMTPDVVTNQFSTYGDQQVNADGAATDAGNIAAAAAPAYNPQNWAPNEGDLTNSWNATDQAFAQSFDSIYSQGGLLDQTPNANTQAYYNGATNLAQGVIGADGKPTYQSAGFIGANNYLNGVVNGTNQAASAQLTQAQMAQGQSASSQANAQGAQAFNSAGAQEQYGKSIDQYGNAVNPNTYLQQTAAGNYNNPYLDATFNQASQAVNANYLNNVVPTTNTTAQMAGRYGSNAQVTQQGADAAAYLQAQNNLATQIYGSAYSAERQNQVNAQSQQAQLQSGMNDTTLGAQMAAAGQNQQNMQYNAGQNTQNSQFNAGQYNSNAQSNAALMQANNQFNAGNMQQANVYNATNQQNANQYNFSQQMNAAGMVPAMDSASFAGLNQLNAVGTQQHNQPWQDQAAAVNMLGVAGGVPLQQDPLQANKPSVVQGAIGGAAAGTAISPGWGTLIGGVVGAAATYV